MIVSASNAAAKSVILEIFPTAGCHTLEGFQNAVASLKEEYGDIFVLTCPLDEQIIPGEYDRKSCTKRSNAYMHQNYMTASVSPLVSLNGRYKMSGSYINIVSSGIKMARMQNEFSKIPMDFNDNRLSAKLPKIKHAKADYELWLFAYNQKQEGVLRVMADHEHDEDGNHSDDPGYENRPIFFENVITDLRKLGNWNGNEESIAVPLFDFEAEGFALVAQEKESGNIVAFGSIETFRNQLDGSN